VAILFSCAKTFAHTLEGHGEIYTIENISKIRPFLEKLDAEAIAVFDVDFVITVPADLIGLPGSKEIRKGIFKEYSQKYGKERAKYLFILFNKLVPRPLLEDEIGTIIQDLLTQKIHTIALSAIGTNPIGPVPDPMAFRLERLKEVGVYFTDLKKGEKFLWGEESGFHEGVILSGKQPKGEALLHYLTEIVEISPSRVVCQWSSKIEPHGRAKLSHFG
ncbi:MAG: DUF2608 domain-containing protein, partial [bacterium]|nr:DUF2608 domain-containing protein [bacterium]